MTERAKTFESIFFNGKTQQFKAKSWTEALEGILHTAEQATPKQKLRQLRLVTRVKSNKS